MKIDPKQIPDEVEREFNRFEGVLSVKERFARALGKWPGAGTHNRTVWKDGIDVDVPVTLILPLSKETQG